MTVFTAPMGVPSYYADKNIYHWSQTKVRMPLCALICEYMIRQPQYRKAKKLYENATLDDPMDWLKRDVEMWDRPANLKMTAGSAVHHAALKIANGTKLTEAFAEIYEQGYRDGVRKETNEPLRDYTPVSFREDDQKFAEYLQPEMIQAVLENASAGYKEALQGANIIVPEERIEVSLPGIDVPVVGYVDAFGNNCVVELKTKWDSASKASKKGFANNSTPKSLGRNEMADVTQVALYRRALNASSAKIVYANRLDYQVHSVPDKMLDGALEDFHRETRVRQNLMSHVGDGEESINKLISITQADFSYFMFKDCHPDQLEIFKQIFYEKQ